MKLHLYLFFYSSTSTACYFFFCSDLLRKCIKLDFFRLTKVIIGLLEPSIASLHKFFFFLFGSISFWFCCCLFHLYVLIISFSGIVTPFCELSSILLFYFIFGFYGFPFDLFLQFASLKRTNTICCNSFCRLNSLPFDNKFICLFSLLLQ